MDYAKESLRLHGEWKNGDLMILYDLLPEIAIAAHKRIHGIETETE